jgi:predicted enzyme related to lactoylglutathione lyase
MSILSGLGLDRIARISSISKIGTARLTIGVHQGVDGISRDPLRIMINLAVTEIHAAHVRLTTVGIPCLRAPSPEPWGGLVATYSDPDDNTVQLMTGTVS